MKKYLLSFLFCVLSLVFASCDKEEDGIEGENTVTWNVTASDAYAHLLFDADNLKSAVRVNSGYKYSYKTIYHKASCSVKCDDEYTIITVKGYLNGKLKVEKEGNQSVNLSISVKN